MSKKLTDYEKAENKFIHELLKKVDNGIDQQRQIDALIKHTKTKIHLAHDKKIVTFVNIF